MKKLLALFLVVVLMFSLSACGRNNDGEYSADDGKVSDNGGSDNNSSDNIVSDILDPNDNNNSSTNSSSENAGNENNNSKNENSMGDNSSANNPTNSENLLISKDKALSIALSHAGVSKTAARDIEIELDRERGATVWEIDFEAGGAEYSFEVNAKTGKITEREREIDF